MYKRQLCTPAIVCWKRQQWIGRLGCHPNRWAATGTDALPPAQMGCHPHRQKKTHTQLSIVAGGGVTVVLRWPHSECFGLAMARNSLPTLGKARKYHDSLHPSHPLPSIPSPGMISRYNVQHTLPLPMLPKATPKPCCWPLSVGHSALATQSALTGQATRLSF